MIFFDFKNKIYPKSEIPYFKEVIQFVENWQSGLKIIKINTSGSTGIPKNISLKRNNMISSAILTCNYFGLNENSHLLCCLNTKYIGGMMMLVRAIESNSKLTVIEPTSNPFENLENQKKYDFLALVPLQLNNILENKVTKAYLISKSKISNILIGGASINFNLEKMCTKIKIPIYNSYGMTETISHIALKRINGEKQQQYFETLDGISIKTDFRNCISIKAKCTNQKWIQTNDIIELITNNSFKLLGRADRVVNSGGFKIYLDLVEKKIEKLLFEIYKSKIRYFLYSKNDQYLGEQLVLFIEAENSKFEATILTKFKKSILNKYEIPKIIYFIPKFIETNNLKIDFIKTRDQAKKLGANLA